MNHPEIIQKIIQQIHIAQKQDMLRTGIYTDNGGNQSAHEFLFFIKPEITAEDDSVNLRAILELTLRKISQFGLKVTDMSVLGAAYLEKFNIIAQHYGVINALSRNPLQFLTIEAEEKFSTVYHCSPEEVNILGSLEFLEKYPAYNAETLNDLWQQTETVKLAGGTYCATVMVGNDRVYLINGFHPRQLIHFTEKGRSIVAFALNGDLHWSDARNKFIGKTNPIEALTGSLRNELLMNRELFGLKSVSASQNGFHLSAGPVEGLVELIRYCSDFAAGKIRQPDDFLFGRLLKAQYGDEEIRRICQNETIVYRGKKISIFDLTEEKDNDTSLQLLKEISFV
jgi:hypothetical protein